jgi:hypothetical protein
MHADQTGKRFHEQLNEAGRSISVGLIAVQFIMENNNPTIE